MFSSSSCSTFLLRLHFLGNCGDSGKTILGREKTFRNSFARLSCWSIACQTATTTATTTGNLSKLEIGKGGRSRLAPPLYILVSFSPIMRDQWDKDSSNKIPILPEASFGGRIFNLFPLPFRRRLKVSVCQYKENSSSKEKRKMERKAKSKGKFALLNFNLRYRAILMPKLGMGEKLNCEKIKGNSVQ